MATLSPYWDNIKMYRRKLVSQSVSQSLAVMSGPVDFFFLVLLNRNNSRQFFSYVFKNRLIDFTAL
jgi:hypothetical protein